MNPRTKRKLLRKKPSPDKVRVFDRSVCLLKTSNNSTSTTFCCSFLVIFLFVLHASPAEAKKPGSEALGPANGITVGPSAGWVEGGPIDNGLAAGVDLTYFHKIKTPVFFWISGGARMWKDKEVSRFMPYAESGIGLLFLNVGAGWGLGVNGPAAPWHAINLFVGINVPIWIPAKGHLLYFEPYYRPTWKVSQKGDGDGGAIHEVGALLKWCFGFY